MEETDEEFDHQIVVFLLDSHDGEAARGFREMDMGFQSYWWPAAPDDGAPVNHDDHAKNVPEVLSSMHLDFNGYW